MVLTPIDIHNKEFTLTLRGYDEDEVNDFLDIVIRDYELKIRDKKQLESKVAQLTRSVEYFQNIEDSLNKAYEISNATADQIVKNAEQAAELMIREARKTAERIISEAMIEARKMKLDTEVMKDMEGKYKSHLNTLIRSQKDMINSKDWDELLAEA